MTQHTTPTSEPDEIMQALGLPYFNVDDSLPGHKIRANLLNQQYKLVKELMERHTAQAELKMLEFAKAYPHRVQEWINERKAQEGIEE